MLKKTIAALPLIPALCLLAPVPALFLLAPFPARAADDIFVGAQYDSTHVYVAPADMDAFVKSFTATFGGQASAPAIMDVTPLPSSTRFRAISTPAGMISCFGFLTPVPFPFGSERTGYLVSDMDKAIAAARASGADVIVAPFPDPIGRDAVIEWPGGVRTQLYWHTKPPSSAPLAEIPDNRVYVSPDRAAVFVRDFLNFSHGKVVADTPRADGGEIGRPGTFYRRIRIESGFGKMWVAVTDGHLPWPFGREITGYAVGDVDATLAKATASGATIASKPFGPTHSAVVKFPGGYIAEIHAPPS